MSTVVTVERVRLPDGRFVLAPPGPLVDLPTINFRPSDLLR